MRVALYARISTHDQHTLAMQIDAMHEFATRQIFPLPFSRIPLKIEGLSYFSCHNVVM